MESKSTKDKKFDSIYRAYKDSIFKVAMQNVKIWQMKLHKRHFSNYIFTLKM